MKFYDFQLNELKPWTVEMLNSWKVLKTSYCTVFPVAKPQNWLKQKPLWGCRKQAFIMFFFLPENLAKTFVWFRVRKIQFTFKFQKYVLEVCEFLSQVIHAKHLETVRKSFTSKKAHKPFRMKGEKALRNSWITGFMVAWTCSWGVFSINHCDWLLRCFVVLFRKKTSSYPDLAYTRRCCFFLPLFIFTSCTRSLSPSILWN